MTRWSCRISVVGESLLRLFRAPFCITRGELTAPHVDEVDDVTIVSDKRERQEARVDGATRRGNGFIDAIGNEEFRGNAAVV